ncbi:MAG: NADH-quinone oxidoreductase subunit [Candidatus Hydrogenedentes bacterium]|nr:NADH-quinone oxidoreductase subunit [Candidatus Hydrogenedentota bacterium]
MDSSGLDTVLLWPLLVYTACVGAVVVGMLGISFVLGQHHKDRTTGEPYECGIVSTDSARVRFPSDFLLIAIFFVIFDLESIFIYAWATAVRELGWFGYGQVCVFIALLLAALVYLWRQRALDV